MNSITMTTAHTLGDLHALLLGGAFSLTGVILLIGFWLLDHRNQRRDVTLLSPTLAVEMLDGAARRAWLLSIVLDLDPSREDLDTSPNMPGASARRALVHPACDETTALALEAALRHALATLEHTARLPETWRTIRRDLDEVARPKKKS